MGAFLPPPPKTLLASRTIRNHALLVIDGNNTKYLIPPMPSSHRHTKSPCDIAALVRASGSVGKISSNHTYRQITYHIPSSLIHTTYQSSAEAATANKSPSSEIIYERSPICLSRLIASEILTRTTSFREDRWLSQFWSCPLLSLRCAIWKDVGEADLFDAQGGVCR